MANVTAGDIIDKAYKKAGVDNPNSTQDADGLDALNNLLTSLSMGGLIIPFLIRENFTLTSGDAEYSIGSGADFDTVRPLKIVSAYLRDSDTDHFLDVSPLKEYNDIVSKTSEGRPENLYYLAEMTDGKILFDYEPDKAYELYIDSEKEITEFALTTTTVASILVPNTYKRFFIYNLAVDLIIDLDSGLSEAKTAEVYRIARETMSDIKIHNMSVRGVKEAKFDSAITYPLRK